MMNSMMDTSDGRVGGAAPQTRKRGVNGFGHSQVFQYKTLRGEKGSQTFKTGIQMDKATFAFILVVLIMDLKTLLEMIFPKIERVIPYASKKGIYN